MPPQRQYVAPAPEPWKDLTLRIRYLPVRLHRQWKVRSAEDGISMNQAVIDALEAWVTRPQEVAQ